MTPDRKNALINSFNIDPSSVYGLSLEELEFLQWEFGEREHILDAMVRLNEAEMDSDQFLRARAEALGCTVQDIVDFG